MTGRGRKVAITIMFISAGVSWLAGNLRAAPYAEDYNFGPAYLPAFAHKTNGVDMLPMTADDGTAALNTNGAFSCDVIDLNGPLGGLNLDWSFHNRKTDDDEQLSLTAHSEFNLGVIAEGESWCDMRLDSGAGATGLGPDGTTVPWSGDDWDWETNDSSSPGFTGWEDGSDYFWYNNAAPNQRGLGGSRYYFEYKNPDQYPGTRIFDEPERYRRANKLRHTWGANPGNGEKRTNFGWDFNIEIRGFLIPISAIHTLPHGSLSRLFGWQSIDMADYVRDVLGAYVDAAGNPINGLEVWDPADGGYNANGSSPPPYKYVYIYETSDRVSLGPPGTNVAAAATHYGVTNEVSATYRTHIVFKGDSDSNLPIDITTPTPSAGPVLVNSWGRDDMIRADYTKVGNLQTGGNGAWTFDIDSVATDSRIVRLAAGAAAADSWIELPTMSLPARNLKTIVGKVRLRLEEGKIESNPIQIALVSGNKSVASGAFKVGRPATVGVGGTIAGGPVTGSVGTPEPPTPDADGDGDVDILDLNAFVGCFTGPEIRTIAAGCSDRDLDMDTDIDQVDFGLLQGCYSGTGISFNRNCTPAVGNSISPGSSYVDLALLYDAALGKVSLTLNGNEMATYTAASATGAFVDGLYVWTGGAENLYVDMLGVYSGSFTCSSTPGDVDGDGDADGDDDLARKACYSGAGKPYRTGIFPSCACLDLDGDYDVDEADGVTP